MKNRIKVVCVFLILAVCLSLCACGDAGVSISDSDTEQTLLDKGYACAFPEDGTEPDYDAARQYFEAAAERGSGEAAAFLGDSYRDGAGFEQNNELAVKWYERGTELGNMYAMCSLGSMLEYGEGCEADPERASGLYLESAKLGNPWAFGSVAHIYHDGIGVEQDLVKAAEWYEKSYKTLPEDVWAMEGYARLLMDGGDGVDRDIDKSAELAEKSLAGSNEWAAYLIPELSYRGHTFSAKTVADAAAQLAKFNDPDTVGWLGDMYCFGDGPEMDGQKALSAYEQILSSSELQKEYSYWDNLLYNCRRLYANGADTEENLNGAVICECAAYGVDIFNGDISDADYSHAMGNIGVDYIVGLDEINADFKRGIAVLEKSGSIGNPNAYLNLGGIYSDGTYVSEDLEKALAYYEKGAALGDSDCAESAAVMHIKGQGCDADFEAALRVLTMNGMQTEAEACNELGVMYYYGQDVSRDMKKAFELFTSSAWGGCSTGVNNLVNMYLAGEGTEKDEVKAFRIASKAAEDGVADSSIYTKLGNMYYQGTGTETDISKALEFYEKGAEGDPAYSYFMIGDIHCYAENTVNDEKALEYYRKALKSMDPSVQFTDDGDLFNAIGYQYSNSDASFHDTNKGREFYDRALDFYMPMAEAGDGDAIYKLVRTMYSENQSYTGEMMEWLNRGAELQNTDCMIYLGGIYIQSGNYSKAVELDQAAYDLGSRDSTLLNNLAYSYTYGLNSPEKGIPLYEELGEYFTLGELYEEGRIVPRDYDKAVNYFIKSGVDQYSSHHIADIYYKMGNYSEAAVHYRLYLDEFADLNPDYVSHARECLNICEQKLAG